ncbi:BAG family molecular chaperone regulator 7-like [Juglans microcarpa x Juglans regia]|uniref:BAG family molecular chaperone regulator 7-like n=1 Tax=Juglans microcarpa x Juglans regia TaxID=2249226 RepID=UPI001B7F1A9D|nr:BAG family molecular chaperone regulator 7-like [Juglans microcarpa x Juglans regia]
MVRFSLAHSDPSRYTVSTKRTMSRLRRIDLIEPCYYPSLFVRDTSIISPKLLAFPSFVEEDFDLSLGLDLLNLSPRPSPLEFFDSVTDLVCVDEIPSLSSYRRIQRVDRLVDESFYLQNLCDRVGVLESRFDRLLNPRLNGGDRKYTWTAEIKSPEKDGADRKYKWTAEIKEGKKEGGVEKNYKWTAEINGRGVEGRPTARTYTFKASSGDAGDNSGSKKEVKKKKKKGESDTRVVEIEEPVDHGAVVLRQAFAKRVGAVVRNKGKKKELSPQDAAMMIQMAFRAYLIRRSQALRNLRELAVAKAKLKEIRALFNNFSYRRHVAQDAAERQRFSEKIIVLLLTVDAIEGADLMVRAAKRSMVHELEAMLDVVDPQPPGKSLSMRRRTFDMPDGVIHKEIAAGVAQVVQMLNREEESGSTFEACL